MYASCPNPACAEHTQPKFLGISLSDNEPVLCGGCGQPCQISDHGPRDYVPQDDVPADQIPVDVTHTDSGPVTTVTDDEPQDAPSA